MTIKTNSKKLISALGISAVLLLSPIADNKAEAAVSTTSIVNTATSFKGVGYKYGGTTPSGFDCSGYIAYVFNKVGVSLPRTTSEMYNRGTAVSKGNLQAGDLVFFTTNGRGTVSHAGIYIGANQFIHAATSKGVSVSSINDPYYWGSRYLGAKRVTEVSQVNQVSNSVGQWVKNGSAWNFNQNGTNKTGWVQTGGKWYYMNGAGVMQTGWQLVNNKWYLLNGSGAMLTGWQKVGHTWYYMNGSGAMQTGWNKVGNTWYFHHNSGAMATGWIQTNSGWYFLYNNGAMAANTKIGSYKLAASGVWVH